MEKLALSSGERSSRVGVVLITWKEHILNCAVRFKFKATSNVIEHEVLLVSLKLAKGMQVKKLIINSDSQLEVSHINDNFLAKDKSMQSI